MLYHYVITIRYTQEWSRPEVLLTESGTITPLPGETRSTLYKRIYAATGASHRARPAVVFFSLEKDELEA